MVDSITNNSLRDYDDVLTSILVNEKSILGFLSAIFNFLARRTDFYYVPEGPYENIGFPPGVSEELVLKVLRKCDPKNYVANGSRKPDHNSDLNNEIMCSTVAQEVEVIAEEDIYEEEPENIENLENETTNNSDNNCARENANNITEPNQEHNGIVETKEKRKSVNTDEEREKPVPPTQRNSETYNGAERDKYSWAQTITDLDVTIKLPSYIKTAKDLKVTVNTGDICVACCSGNIMVKDTLPYKIKAIDTFWSVSDGKLLIHLEKVQERWWNKLLSSEEPIDLSVIDCSRPFDELPEDHIAKVRELQWNQEQKLKGLPTSDEIRNMDVLKKAWNAPGSPFLGQPFDPNVLNQSSLGSFSKQ